MIRSGAITIAKNLLIALKVKQVAGVRTNIVQPSFSKYAESIRLILFNQVVVATITTAAFHYPMKLTGDQSRWQFLVPPKNVKSVPGVSFEKRLPPWITVLAQVLFCIAIEEIGFYYSHR